MTDRTRYTPLMKAVLFNLAILAIWYLLELSQFGELQHGRHCDDAVFLIYSCLTYALFSKIDRLEKICDNKNNINAGNTEKGDDEDADDDHREET